jgi:hypothetical protein
MLASASVVPRCLTIATSDSGGGAGIQADLKAFARLGCHGMSAIVALTAQSTTEVRSVHEAPPEFIRDELDVLFEDIGVDGAKTGMLFSTRIIETVADFLDGRQVPLVVDPVMVAASGAQLLQDDAVSVLVERLFPLATVVTPNLHAGCPTPTRRIVSISPRRSTSSERWQSSSRVAMGARPSTGSSTASATCRSRWFASVTRPRMAPAARTRPR